MRLNSKIIFAVFLGSVFCVNVSSRKSLAVTGGEDDAAYVWNVSNGDVVFKCTGQRVLLLADITGGC